MKKKNKPCFSVIFLFLLFVTLNSAIVISDETTGSEIDYTNTDSIASASPSEIDISQAIATGNAAAVTAEQWTYGDNLNFVDDLSLYTNAQEAIETKYSGLTLSMQEGHVTYTNGVIQNGEVALDINDKSFAGTRIIALEGGGFLIEKGSSDGLFEVQENNIDLSNEKATATIETNNKVILSEGAILTDTKGTNVISLAENTEIITTNEEIHVKGIALITDAQGNFAIVGDYENIQEGVFSLDYMDGAYVIESTAIDVSSAEIKTETSDLKANTLVFLDTNALTGAAKVVKSSFSADLKEFCTQDGCVASSQYTSVSDIAGALTAKAEPYYEAAEELGLPKEVVTTVGVAGIIASGYLPSEKKFQTKDGDFSAVLGYTQDGFTPFIVGEYKNVQVKAEPNVALGSKDSSLTAVASSPTSFTKISAHLDLENKGTVDISASGQKVSMTYQTQVGSVAGSVNVYKSDEMKGVFLKLDLSRFIN